MKATDLDLSSTDLNERRLEDIDFEYSNFNKAQLRFTNFSGSTLIKATLNLAAAEGAIFSDTLLKDCTFKGTNLASADFSRANLSGSRFENSDLTNASFAFADMEGVYWVSTDLSHVTLDSLATAQHLDKITGPVYALISLRQQLHRNGYRRAERALTAAIRRASSPPIWETILFDSTCGYGANSGRLLFIALSVWVICSLIYLFSLFGKGREGIYLVITRPTKNQARTLTRRQRLRYRFNIPRAIASSVLFSTLASLTLPIKGINARAWILRTQKRDFEMDADGWVRVVSGVQTILVLLLVSLFFAVYLGNPFDAF